MSKSPLTNPPQTPATTANPRRLASKFRAVDVLTCAPSKKPAQDDAQAAVEILLKLISDSAHSESP